MGLSCDCFQESDLCDRFSFFKHTLCFQNQLQGWLWKSNLLTSKRNWLQFAKQVEKITFEMDSIFALVAQLAKNLLAAQKTQVQSLGWEDPLEKEMATYSSILAWRIPQTEEPGGLQSMGSHESEMT